MTKLNIIAAGFIVGGPLGGLVWHHLQYVLGLQQLGHNILFVEDSDDYASCYDPHRNELTTDPKYGLQFISNVFTTHGLKNNWAYYSVHTNNWYGKTEQELKEFIDEADIFLNLSGVNPLRELFQKIPCRVFIDTDPAFTQIRHLTETERWNRAMLHNRFFTYGENFGKQNCTIPDDGLPWQPTRQPVVLNKWRYSLGNYAAKWTTVMQWDSYKVREYNGQVYGMKSSSFDDYFNLPKNTSDFIELAIGSETAPKEKLISGGWFVTDPLSVALTPEGYQKYISQSKGEWSIAKHGYVTSNSGWFSERSACYLASGRPVGVQDTGFSYLFETGKGLLAFSTPDESVACIEQVNSNYGGHCKHAREIAEEYFNSDKVLTSMINRLP